MNGKRIIFTDHSNSAFMSIIKDARRFTNYKDLSETTKRELWNRVASGDMKSRNEIAQHNMLWVVTLAKRYQRNGAPLEDIVMAGYEGLLKAIGRFEPNRGCTFLTYATAWIKYCIGKAIEEYRIVSVPRGKKVTFVFDDDYKDIDSGLSSDHEWLSEYQAKEKVNMLEDAINNDYLGENDYAEYTATSNSWRGAYSLHVSESIIVENEIHKYLNPFDAVVFIKYIRSCSSAKDIPLIANKFGITVSEVSCIIERARKQLKILMTERLEVA